MRETLYTQMRPEALIDMRNKQLQYIKCIIANDLCRPLQPLTYGANLSMREPPSLLTPDPSASFSTSHLIKVVDLKMRRSGCPGQ